MSIRADSWLAVPTQIRFGVYANAYAADVGMVRDIDLKNLEKECS